MNRRMVMNTVGKIILAESVFLLLPAAVALIYREACLLPILLTSAFAFLTGGCLSWFCKPKDSVIYAREGFMIVSFSWGVLSMIGALPFWLSGEIPSYVDALFEIVSGFTTTGASILPDVEAMSRGLLFWRSFTHWIGGMGILVFVMAVLPNVSDRSIHILRAEVPGPVVGKLVPRMKDTAKILYLIYLVMTGVQILLLLAGGMSPFAAILHAFGTAGTGGFGVKADSLGGYSPYLQWVVAVFMLLFGVNFNLYYLFLIRRFRAALKSRELWTYVGIIAVATVVITVNIHDASGTWGESLRHAFFQVSSIITTTGYSTVDFNLWPALSKGILLVLMVIGGCAGSTAGGLKVSRVVLIGKQIRRELQKLLHPRSVKSIHFEGRPVDEHTLTGVSSYLSVYLFAFGIVFLLICWEPFGFETNFSAVMACFNNVGPGLASVGPLANYAAYSDFSKLVLSFAMLLGRLEIFPLIIFLSPSTWMRKKV